MARHVRLGELDSYREDADGEDDARDLEGDGIQSGAVAAAPAARVEDVDAVGTCGQRRGVSELG